MHAHRSIWTQKRFLAYASGLAIDRLGNAAYALVLPLLVYSLTQSVLNMATMAVSQFLPRALFSIFVGALVDKMNRRTVLITALLFQGMCNAAVALCFQLHVLKLWIVYLAGACVSIGFEFSRTAEIAVVPVMFAERRVEATASLASIFTATVFLGPLLGGWLLQHVDYPCLFWINAASYLGPIALCGLSEIPGAVGSQTQRSVSSVIASIRAGAAFLLRTPDLWQLFLITLLVSLASSGLGTVLIYSLKHQQASDAYVAIFLSLGGLGMLLGSIWVGKSHDVSRSRRLGQCHLSMIGGLLLFLSANHFAILLAQVFLSAGVFASSIMQDIVVQDFVPNEMMGRVGGFLRLLSHVTISASIASSSVMVDIVGVTGTLLLATAVVLLGMLLLMWKTGVEGRLVKGRLPIHD